jgi:hypothetical protein
MRGSAVAALAIVLVHATGVAGQQVDAPAPGTWGAETNGSAASVLRFRSAGSAWILGGSLLYSRNEAELSSGAPVRSSFSRATVRVGVRRYRNSEARLRPFHSVTALLTTISGNTTGFGGGAELEIGAAHFFSRHLSLGASGFVSAQYEERRDSQAGTSLKQRIWLAQLGMFRMLATVFF